MSISIFRKSIVIRDTRKDWLPFELTSLFAMAKSSYAQSFRDLRVFQLAVELSKEIFQLTKRFPKEERYALTDQIRRSSRSVGAQLAEGWGKRKYENHFVMKLTDADAEQLETQYWIETARDCGYITQEVADSLIKKYADVGKMLGGMMDKAALFCKQKKP